jgi:hypothetical protein
LLPWGTWYFSGLRLLSQSLSPVQPAAGSLHEFEQQRSSLGRHLDELAAKLAQPDVDPTKLHGDINDVANSVRRLRAQAAQTPIDAALVDRFLLQAAAGDFAPADWDEAAQRFLALQALWAAWQAAQPLAADAAPRHVVDAALETIRGKLQFPTLSPEASLHPSSFILHPSLDSPRDFDPAAVGAAFQSAATAIHAVAKTGGSK